MLSRDFRFRPNVWWHLLLFATATAAFSGSRVVYVLIGVMVASALSDVVRIFLHLRRRR